MVVPKADTKDSETRQRKRASWPGFQLPTDSDLGQLSPLRCLSRQTLELAVRRGLLRVAQYRGHRCWIITDNARMAAQARRLDGQPFQTKAGPTKALTLPGSFGAWLVGSAALEPRHRSVLLVEGGPDLLAAHEFILREGRQTDSSAVAMLGASGAIQVKGLVSLKGRKVRIAEHNDAAGEKAAKRWAGQLRRLVVKIDGISFAGLKRRDGKPVNDLNDAVLIADADLNANPFLGKVIP